MVTVHQQIRRKLTLLVGFSSATFGGFTTFVVVARRFRVGFGWLVVAGGAFVACLRGASVVRDLPHCRVYEHRVSGNATKRTYTRAGVGSLGLPVRGRQQGDAPYAHDGHPGTPCTHPPVLSGARV